MEIAFYSDEDCWYYFFFLVTDLWIVTFEISAKNLPTDPLARQWPVINLLALWEPELGPGDFLVFSDPLPKPCFSGLTAGTGQS